MNKPRKRNTFCNASSKDTYGFNCLFLEDDKCPGLTKHVTCEEPKF